MKIDSSLSFTSKKVDPKVLKKRAEQFFPNPLGQSDKDYFMLKRQTADKKVQASSKEALAKFVENGRKFFKLQ